MRLSHYFFGSLKIPFDTLNSKWLEKKTFISHLVENFRRGPTTRSLGDLSNYYKSLPSGKLT